MSAAGAKSEPLGARAVRSGYVSAEEVGRALREQQHRQDTGKRRSPLGLLMVEMGILSPRLLVNLLDLHGSSGFHLHEDAVALAATLNASLEEGDRGLLVTGLDRGTDVGTLLAQVGSALALLEPGPVLLIDADFQNPSLHQRFYARQAPGLSDILERKVSPDEAVFSTGIAGLSLLPTGGSAMDFVKLLMSDDCRGLLETLRAKYRLILVRAAPLGRHAESTLLAARMNAALLVVVPGRQQRHEVEEFKRTLDGLKVKFVGVVLAQPERRRRFWRER
jgi:Mrp family chromosome partitioning ATPase